ncbi:hypothetical protein PH586_03700 [Pseudomonas sp. SA3-5]|uniref:Uncharacterized protein n=1 Tax=Pseudomonas aestuarii TaxID=3018340 RepID=A0ABT4XAS1_9PSED|nr:hypothetical protein [Pseudomonas aestuarii]MDA7085496.1 hypothetical protein [Pseudomonas aestuarii]
MSLLAGLIERVGVMPRPDPPAPSIEPPAADYATRRAPACSEPIARHAEPGPREEPRHFICTAATASLNWRQIRDQYINHLMNCRACHAPTNRYCASGADLRQHYEQTPMEHAQ